MRQVETTPVILAVSQVTSVLVAQEGNRKGPLCRLFCRILLDGGTVSTVKSEN